MDKLTVNIKDALIDFRRRTCRVLTLKELGERIYANHQREAVTAGQRMTKLQQGKLSLSAEDVYLIARELELSTDDFLRRFTNIKKLNSNANRNHHIRKRTQERSRQE